MLKHTDFSGNAYTFFLYNKTIIVDLCFGRHKVLLNSKPNHNDLRSASVIMIITVQ